MPKDSIKYAPTVVPAKRVTKAQTFREEIVKARAPKKKTGAWKSRKSIQNRRP